MYNVCTGQVGCFGYSRVHDPAANTLLLGFDGRTRIERFHCAKEEKKYEHTIKDYHDNVIFIQATSCMIIIIKILILEHCLSEHD